VQSALESRPFENRTGFIDFAMSSEDQKPQEPGAEQKPQEEKPQPPDAEQSSEVEVLATASITTVAPVGKRQSFRGIRRELQEVELANPGVQRLILEDLETAESECEALREYVDRYHEADKRAAVLEEKLRAHTALEILFAVGLGIGFAIVGLAPYFWDGTLRGPAVLAVGTVLIICSVAARIVKLKR
jgi:hypothetical protein